MAGSVSSLRRTNRYTPSSTPARVHSPHAMPWPTCVATGPGQASEIPQPTPNTRLPAMWRRAGRSATQPIGPPVSRARVPVRRRSATPTAPTSTAEAKKRNRYESWNSSASRITSGLVMPLQDSTMPKTRPTPRPAARERI